MIADENHFKLHWEFFRSKAKLIELKTKGNLMELTHLKKSIIVHYGCSDFNSDEHKVYWIGAIGYEPNKTYFFENRNEIEAIEKFYKYVQDNKEKTFIHWSMNSPKFGFKAIENRFFELTNKNIDFDIRNEIDLSEYLKNKYGINYIERQNGRLNNLAALNGFSGVKSDVEVININDATNRLELIFSIVQAEIQGNLKTNTALPPKQTEKPEPKQDEVLSLQITHPKRTEIARAINGKYRSYKGKDFKILYEALLQLDLFPKKGKRSVFFRCLQNEGYNINNVQMLENKHFKTGYKNLKGDYESSEDEIQRDGIIEYLKTIIETK